eukprot:CAMPEP_0115055544 /NCGR_PEP_ID=MMETSP0227-20121206/4708_1 /TAXON_ID=89957 /ORGANISM="Polarella glacialis, Strain CCMP 1383" /LENGTH=190 /DNA_ID=CAMNT_0002440141 /DNA_START=36 /DNA_END=608 /DNA_ORIENTATION=+
MFSKLPKLQLPTGEEAQRKLNEASELARAGELKEAQKLLKEGVASGLLEKVLQRQVLVWWSAGEFDVLKPAGGETAAEVRKTPASAVESRAAPEGLEASVTKVMREKQFSRKEACKYIDEGGLEMEEMQAEQNRPMDEAFAKMRENGPPAWFVESMKAAQEKEAAEAAHDWNGLQGEDGPAGPPQALAPP